MIDKVIGLVNKSFSKRKDILFIDDFIVNKVFRSKGIGKLLIQNAMDYAIKKLRNSRINKLYNE